MPQRGIPQWTQLSSTCTSRHAPRPPTSPLPDVNPPARASTPPTWAPRLPVHGQRPVPLRGQGAGPEREIRHRNDADGDNKANHHDGRLRATLPGRGCRRPPRKSDRGTKSNAYDGALLSITNINSTIVTFILHVRSQIASMPVMFDMLLCAIPQVRVLS